MGHINILPKNVSELIAAGEVVDRPSSLVKELVENSIDAGADKIIIEIKNGGISYISVSDNGCGMEKEDIPKAFIRHATSKIISSEDLDKIGTMGFRGEALPSAAAVAHVTVSSKTPSQSSGWYFDALSGEISPVGAVNGTTVTVTELFYNTPARMKFLKRDITEGNAIETLLQRMCLSNPNIAFTFIREGKEKIKTHGDGELKLTVRAVFGSEIARGMLPISRESGGIKVEGLVMAAELSKNSRSLQVFFINKRLVNSNTCRSALEEAYKNRITVGKFPAGIINITMDFSLVDVNVHPAKLEVRFQNEREVYNAIYSAVLEALQGKDTEQGSKAPKINIFSLKDFDYKKEQINFGEKPVEIKLKDDTAFNDRGEVLVKPMGHKNYFDVDIEVDEDFNKKPPIEESTEIQPTFQKEKPKIEMPVLKEEESKNTPVLPYKVLGEVFNTYILVEQQDKFILIDKHAAHEGYIYYSIKNSYRLKDFNRQILLTPEMVSLRGEDFFIVEENLSVIASLGIEAEEFGNNTFIVREIPQVLEGCDLSGIFSDIAQNLKEGKKNISPEFLDRLLYSVSCRGATMAGKASKMPELGVLAAMVMEKSIEFCPHGRPCRVELTKREIDKMFSRLG